MLNLMRWTMMRSTTSLPPVLPRHPRVGGEKVGVAISTLGHFDAAVRLLALLA
jgi:hypothetical protein